MNRPILAALIPLLFISSLALTLRPDAPQSPAVQWVGPDSKHPPGFVLIQSDQDWRDLWTAHTGLSSRHAAPKVDFTRYTIVAYFRGPSPNRDGEVLQSILHDSEGTILRFESSTFQSLSLDGPDRGSPAASYGIWLIPRTLGPIIVEEGRWESKVQPYHYVEVARLGGC